jgi:hypothetical protein
VVGRDSFVLAYDFLWIYVHTSHLTIILSRTDLVFGSITVVYSTASLLTWLNLDGSDTLVVYGYAGQSYEVSLKLSGTVELNVEGPTEVHGQAMRVSFRPSKSKLAEV